MDYADDFKDYYHMIAHYRVSSKTHEGVKQVFDDLTQMIFDYWNIK